MSRYTYQTLHQSVVKAVNLARKKKDNSVVFRGQALEEKWIPDDVLTLQLEVVKLIDMGFITGYQIVF